LRICVTPMGHKTDVWILAQKTEKTDYHDDDDDVDETEIQ